MSTKLGVLIAFRILQLLGFVAILSVSAAGDIEEYVEGQVSNYMLHYIDFVGLFGILCLIGLFVGSFFRFNKLFLSIPLDTLNWLALTAAGVLLPIFNPPGSCVDGYDGIYSESGLYEPDPFWFCDVFTTLLVVIIITWVFITLTLIIGSRDAWKLRPSAQQTDRLVQPDPFENNYQKVSENPLPPQTENQRMPIAPYLDPHVVPQVEMEQETRVPLRYVDADIVSVGMRDEYLPRGASVFDSSQGEIQVLRTPGEMVGAPQSWHPGNEGVVSGRLRPESRDKIV